MDSAKLLFTVLIYVETLNMDFDHICSQPCFAEVLRRKDNELDWLQKPRY